MPDKKQVDIEAILNDDEIMTEAYRKGIIEAIKRHIAGGVPMVSWKDGKTVEIPVEKLIEMLPPGLRPAVFQAYAEGQ